MTMDNKALNIFDNREYSNNLELIPVIKNDDNIKILIDMEKEEQGSVIYSPSYTKEDWIELMDQSDVYFIKNNNQIVGNLSFEILNDKEIHISGLFIDRKYRGQGIARNIMKDFIKNNKNYNISLVTHPDNPAKYIYESLNFKVVDIIDNYFGDGEPRVKMLLNNIL